MSPKAIGPPALETRIYNAAVSVAKHPYTNLAVAIILASFPALHAIKALESGRGIVSATFTIRSMTTFALAYYIAPCSHIPSIIRCIRFIHAPIHWIISIPQRLAAGLAELFKAGKEINHSVASMGPHNEKRGAQLIERQKQLVTMGKLLQEFKNTMAETVQVKEDIAIQRQKFHLAVGRQTHLKGVMKLILTLNHIHLASKAHAKEAKRVEKKSLRKPPFKLSSPIKRETLIGLAAAAIPAYVGARSLKDGRMALSVASMGSAFMTYFAVRGLEALRAENATLKRHIATEASQLLKGEKQMAEFGSLIAKLEQGCRARRSYLEGLKKEKAQMTAIVARAQAIPLIRAPLAG